MVNLNILLRGQSNAVILGWSDQSTRIMTNEVQRLLGFDGVNDRVTLQFQWQDPNGNNTATGGTALVGDWLRPAGATWQTLALEQGLLNFVAALPPTTRADPTVVLWLHNEYDSLNPNLTTATWESAVRYDAALVRNTFGRQDIPYVFVEPIYYPTGTDTGAQAIRVGMEGLVADPGFNARITASNDDLDMTNVVFGAGGHMTDADTTLVAIRAARTVAETFAAYARPGSPVAVAGGNIPDDGPVAVQAAVTGPRQVTVNFQFDGATGFAPLDADAASGLGWTVRTGNAVLAATGAALGPGNAVVLSFGSDLPAGGQLFYGWGNTQLARGTGANGNAIYDNLGLPAKTPAVGIPLTTPDLLFAQAWYLGTYPDVAAAGVSPKFHFDTAGWREGRNPNALFETAGYLSANGDVAAAGVNPLDHYRIAGWREGRDPSQNFDIEAYLGRHPDVRAAGFEPLTHYLQFGQAEGRSIGKAVGPAIRDGFDAEFYRLSNPDIGRAGVDPLAHFSGAGWREGRDPNGYFDSSAYLARYSDVATAGLNPLVHYNQSGFREGRDPSAAFDTRLYLTTYPDVAAAGLNPLLHYLSFGNAEGRLPVTDGILG